MDAAIGHEHLPPSHVLNPADSRPTVSRYQMHEAAAPPGSCGSAATSAGPLVTKSRQRRRQVGGVRLRVFARVATSSPIARLGEIVFRIQVFFSISISSAFLKVRFRS